jgi:hypothetical protein
VTGESKPKVRISIGSPSGADAVEEKRFGIAIHEAMGMVEGIQNGYANVVDTYVLVSIVEMLLRKSAELGNSEVRAAFARSRGLLLRLEEQTRVELYHPGKG